jgi:hypothetical protein
MDIKDRLLNEMFKRQLYPTKDLIDRITLSIKKGDINEKDLIHELGDHSPDTLLTVRELSDFLGLNYDDLVDEPNIHINNGDISTNKMNAYTILNDSQKKCMADLFKYAHIRTEYLKPGGSFTINFDLGKAKNYIGYLPDNYFYDYLCEIIESYCKILLATHVYDYTDRDPAPVND